MEKDGNIVTLHPKCDKKPKKDIANEPEMVELKSMVQDGELDQTKTKKYLDAEVHSMAVSKTKQLTLRISDDLHKQFKAAAAAQGTSMGNILEDCIRKYIATTKEASKSE